MKDATTLLHLGGQWHAVGPAGLQAVDDYPRISQPVWVIEDFADAPAGAVCLQGKADHAPALIESRVRADGLVDGESRVLIHRRNKAADGVQVLYTAVPLPLWQQVMGWAAAQKDHCLVVPLNALLAAGVGKGAGRVLRHGRRLLFFAQLEEGLAYAAVNAYSDTQDDLAVAARSLGAQARSACGDAHRVHIEWCPLEAHAADDERLRQLFAAATGYPVHPCPLAPQGGDDRRGMHSALPYLLSKCTVGLAVNPLRERLAAGAEYALPLSATAAIIVALGLLGVGAFAHWQAATEAGTARNVIRQAAAREQAAQTLARKAVAPEYAGIKDFVDGLSTQDLAYNPQRALSVLQKAANADVRILRLRLEPAADKTAGLVVDGALREGADPSALTRFLLRVRTAGYDATPLEPADGGQGGSFTYRLVKKDNAS